MNSATQIGDVKTLLAPCLELGSRSVVHVLFASNVPMDATIWLKTSRLK